MYFSLSRSAHFPRRKWRAWSEKARINWLRMPFKKGFIFREKEVPFLFKIMTLEIVADYLKIPLDELFEHELISSDKMPQAFVWAGYLAACKEMYKKPKYKEEDSAKWNEFMPKSSRDKITAELALLLGSLTSAANRTTASSKKKESP